MNELKIILLFSLVMFTLGCVDQSGILYNTTGGSRDHLYNLSGGETPKAINQTDLSEFYEDFCDDTGLCMAFVCKNESSIYSVLPWVETSLKGGQCWVLTGYGSKDDAENAGLTPANNYTMLKAKDDLNAQYDFLRVGSGSSFLDGILMDYFTNCTNTMTVKWLKSDSNNRIYPFPNRERLECMLEKNQIPVIVIDKGDADLTIGTSSEIPPFTDKVGRIDELHRLVNYSFKTSEGDSIGPVILVLEAGADVSDAYYVLREAHMIKQRFPEVLIAVNPPDENRTEFLDAVIYGKGLSTIFECEHSITSERNVSYCVDIIAENIILNDLNYCNPHYAMVEVTKRGMSNLKGYSKPSILFSFGGKPGNNTLGTCEWFNTDIANAYESLMRSIPFMAHVGYLGAQHCSGFSGTILQSSFNPYCDENEYSLRHGDRDDERAFKVWTVNTWGYIYSGSHSLSLFSAKGGYSSSCVTLANLDWVDPSFFLYEDARDPFDTNYTFYNKEYIDLLNIGSDSLTNTPNKCTPCFPCGVLRENSFGIQTMTSGISLNLVPVNCNILLDTNNLEKVNITAFADAYDLDYYSIHAFDDVSSVSKEDVSNYYKSYKACQEKIKRNWDALDRPEFNEKRASWVLMALSFHDYYSLSSDKPGDKCGMIIDEYISSSSPFSLDNYLGDPAISINIHSDAKKVILRYTEYISACKDIYYEGRCF